MSLPAGIITIGIDPMIRLGSLTLAWHGVTIGLGVLVGGWLASRDARRRGLDPEPLPSLALVLVAGALVGSRVFFLAEHGELDNPSVWIGSRGFTFYGGFILAALGLAVYVGRRRLSIQYLDTIALGLPLGYAIGRIGDIINGEHYGPATNFVLGVRNTNPAADVPSHAIAYHNGGLYESLIGMTVFVIALSLRKRFRQPLAMVWLVLGLLTAGRFVEFFVRSDSQTGALGLETAQWTSLALIALAGAGIVISHRRLARGDP